MSARCPGMEPPPAATPHRRLPVRGVCLAVALLCALAATTGAIARSGQPAHHHHHAVAATTAAVDTATVYGKRSTPDLAVAEPISDTALAAVRTTIASTAPPSGTRTPPARTRGPPAAA